ncbi:MAG: DUF2442 domain-containing protein [Candidatus Eremiobacteraeota bacterium]|nr:DUF2442 domain-containing protein [Candidatus Eremiobacteraeota bacterium]MBV8644886.1 DUF2442 domain-containing protein [Candidatus Eremiobacteraeota bacterium]
MKAKIPIVTDAEIAAARRRGEEADRLEPRADRIEYDRRNKRLVIHLRRGAVVALPIALLTALHDATPQQLAEVQASERGDAIINDELDVQISLNGILTKLVGLTGAAVHLGMEGGKKKSPAKTAAARANGKRGGRPRKKSAGG